MKCMPMWIQPGLVAACIVLGAATSLPATSASAQEKLDRTALPVPEPRVKAITTLDARNAKAPPRFEVKAPQGAPNVVIVGYYLEFVIDSTGRPSAGRFVQSCMGHRRPRPWFDPEWWEWLRELHRDGRRLTPEELRGTCKFNQHKPADDIAANVSGQRAAGRADIAEAIERHWPGR